MQFNVTFCNVYCLIFQSPNWALLPLGINFMSIVFGGFLADFLQNKNLLTVWSVRKIFHGIGSFGLCFFLLAFILLSGSPGWGLPLFCLIVFANGFLMMGFFLTHIDLTTKYAGPLMGITNLLATLMGFVAPICVSIFLDGFVSSAIYFLTFLWLYHRFFFSIRLALNRNGTGSFIS